jgi:hypothetical protein
MSHRSQPVLSLDYIRSPRFEVREHLGSGGAGMVFRAYDRELAEEVAVKVLHDASPRAAGAIRREFEALRAFSHPNVVALRDLFDGEAPPFFSMELVVGENLRDHVRRGDGFDEARLRDSFAQLTRALRAMHRAGRTHRDVKPQNVRVTAQGRVVLLDLGLSAPAMGSADVSPSAGTLPYMAPEQFTGQALPQSDFYSLGVVMFECLTGARPFAGRLEEVVVSKQTREPPRASDVHSVPEDLDELCRALMSLEPEERPDALHILSVLEPERRPASSASFMLGAVPFVGRDREIEQVVELYQQRGQDGLCVFVSASSGDGKSAFLSAVSDAIAREHESTWVLRGRAEPRPWLPYQAFAPIARQLVERLKECSESFVASILPPDAHLVTDLFPSFKRLSAYARLDEGARAPDLVERRWRAFAAFLALLREIASRVKLVIVVDDLHWLDGDSHQLLLALLPRGFRVGHFPLPITFLLGSEAPPHSGLPTPELSLSLGPLPGDTVRSLAAELLDARRYEAFADANRWLTSGASPRVAVESIRHALFFEPEMREREPDLSLLFRERLGGLDASARKVAEICAIAGRPLSPSTLSAVADADASDVARAIGVLRSSGILADSLCEERAVELACLSLRSVILSTLDPRMVFDGNMRLLTIEQSSEPRPSPTLLRYQLGAGHLEAARRTAQALARIAEEVLAFEYAVHVYELASAAWEGQPDEVQREVLKGLAQALSAAGHTARAAEAYDRASEGAKVAEALELRRKAAEHWLRSGHIDQGMRQLSTLLSAVGAGFEKTKLQRVASLLFERARLSVRGYRFKPRAARQISARELTTIDVFWSVGSLVGLVDFVPGADFQTRAVRAALKAGEPTRVAKALCLEAAFGVSTEDPPRARAKQMTEIAKGLAEELDDPYLHGLVHLAQAARQGVEGNYDECTEQGLLAEAFFRERCTQVTWEIGQVQQLVVLALLQQGKLDQLVSRVEVYTREAKERGDLYGYTNIVTAGGFMAPLLLHKPDDAERLVADAMRRWPRTSFHMQHFFELVALAQVELYRGEGRTLDRVQAAWPEARRAMLLRVPMLHASLLWQLGLSQLERARMDAKNRTDLLARTDRVAKQLISMPVSQASALSILLEAQVAHLNGRKDRALSLASRALELVEQCGAGLFRERAMYMKGMLLGGETGAELMEAAATRLLSLGVVYPSAYLRQALPALEIG